MVRLGRLALPIPVWQAGALLLRHGRKWKVLVDAPKPGRVVERAVLDDRRLDRLKIGRPDGIRTRILGLKVRDPKLLDDKAVNRVAGIAVYVARRTTRVQEDSASCIPQRTHTVTPLRPANRTGLGGRRILVRTLAD